MYYEINVAKRTRMPLPPYRHFFATSPRSCTTLDQTKIVLKELVEKFPAPEYSISISYYAENAEIMHPEEILEDFETNNSPNRLIQMFDLRKIKQEIKDCQKDECVILLNNFSINRPKYTEEEALDGLPESDWEEMEDRIGKAMSVNQYDDLIVDPYNLVD